jgi:sulfite reductase alpha subunit-like flavoprotein
MRAPGPVVLDPALMPPKPKPLANEPDAQSGPRVPPGTYHVAFSSGAISQSASLTIVPDPRLTTPQEDHVKQYDLLMKLNASLSNLNGGVNRLRLLKKQLGALGDRVTGTHSDLADQAKAASSALTAVEMALVDIHRTSPRDVLRNPAGLNDTLVDCINNVVMSDGRPTRQAEEVSHLIMGKVAEQLAKLEGVIAGSVAAVNAGVIAGGISPVS